MHVPSTPQAAALETSVSVDQHAEYRWWCVMSIHANWRRLYGWPRCAPQGKKARMQREASGELRKLSKVAAQTLRESKRRMPKVLSWGRTN
jgi:hypothetical protein